jgi:hypothetical protein
MTIATAFARFGKRWASTGTAAEPSENQADAGLTFLGANPPTFGLHNAMFQWLDDKDNWLYGQIAAVLSKAGVTPDASDLNALRDALAAFAGSGIPASIGVTQPVTAPSWASRAAIQMWGPGGSGGGSFGTNGAGSAGGGGEYREGVVAVTGGQAYLVTIGQAGTPGNGNPTNGAAGTPTSFGSLMTALAGTPGAAGNNGIQAAAGPGGTGGAGGTGFNGNSGGTGFQLPNGAMAQGVGGGTFGVSNTPVGVSTTSLNGAPGVFPGGGGNGGIIGGAGGAGARGLVKVLWLP